MALKFIIFCMTDIMQFYLLVMVIMKNGVKNIRQNGQINLRHY